MATKGTAGKSASGAAMSKYDVEVEQRLHVIEARLAEIEVALYQENTDTVNGKLDRVIGLLKSKFPAVFKDL
jgi:hypothetical protein